MSKVTLTPTGVAHGYTITGRKHSFTVDVDTSLKGGDTAVSPHEAALGALAGCTVITMALYAARKGWPISFEITEVVEDKVDDPDDTSTGAKAQIPRIKETITIKGDITDGDLAKLLEIGKKCPVYLLMTGKKVIETELVRAAVEAQATTAAASPI
jgi:putative redox protein